MAKLLQDWDDYYQHFNKTKAEVRDGCHPQIYRRGGQRRAIVLVHGLTDSPYFLGEIGEYFAAELGFDVYIPLLLAHGLKDPQDMQDASASGWKENVAVAIEAAQASGGPISIGGFSTGGTLSVGMAINRPEAITGGVFLFSAALGLQVGDLVEALLRTHLIAPLVDLLEGAALVDDSPHGNPYRYSYMDKGGAGELSRLIQELDELKADRVVKQPLFAVHSEMDTTALLAEVEKLVQNSPRAELFKIGQSFNVSHANIVLKHPVLARNGSPLEAPNPCYSQMMQALHEFANKHQLLTPKQFRESV